MLSRPPISASERGSPRGAPFGVPVVPLVRIVIRGDTPGLGGAVDSARGDQGIERIPGALLVVGPGAPATARRLDVPERFRVLVVVDEQVRALPARHLADLRSGERRVEQDDAGATFGGGKHGVHESPVVAHEDRNPFAGLEPVLAPRVGERVRALIELPVAELASFVDQGQTIAVPDRRRGNRTAE